MRGVGRDRPGGTARRGLRRPRHGDGTFTNPASGNFVGADPVFGPDGELYVAYANRDATTLAIVKSSDCGNTWGSSTTISPTLANHDIGIIAKCANRVLIYPTIDIDRSTGPRRGWVYSAWTDAASAGTCPSSTCPAPGTTDIRFSRSLDGGANWSAPTIVNTDTALVDQFHPWLAVDDSDGSINVSWYDTRGDATRKKTNVYYRRSTDGGSSWEAEVKVTTAQSDETSAGSDPGKQYGDYKGIAAYGCKAWPLWTDRRSGGKEQIYSATVDNSPCNLPTCTATAAIVPPGLLCEGGTVTLSATGSAGSGCPGGFQYRWTDTTTSAVVRNWSTSPSCSNAPVP